MGWDNPVVWNKISARLYSAIYTELKDRLSLHSVAGLHGPVYMTTWSIDDAPILKSEGDKTEDGGVSDKPEGWNYYLATARYLEKE